MSRDPRELGLCLRLLALTDSRVGLGRQVCPSAMLLGAEPAVSSQERTLVTFVTHTSYVPAILRLHVEPREMLTGLLRRSLAVTFAGWEPR